MKKVFFFIFLAIAVQTTIAQEGQYQLVVTSVSYSGNCGGMKNSYDYYGFGGALQKAITNGMSKHYNGQTFISKQFCEAALHSMSGSTNGCTAIVSGYCRPLGGNSVSVGNANVLGVGQGSSFYSINGANEIRDWSNDEMERMLALNKDYNSFSSDDLSTGNVETDMARNRARANAFRSSAPYIGEGRFKGIPDAPLVEANSFGQANMDNVNHYLENSQGMGIAYLANPQDLSLMLQRKFQSLTCSEDNPLGFDVNEIINKTNRTDAEKQALADYNEYAKRMCDQMASEIEQQMARIDKSDEKKQLDMAILAHDCYGSGDPRYLGMTDYKRVHPNDVESNPYIKSLAEAIEVCNNTNFDTGFHSVLYYNEKTKSLVIGCEGSSDIPVPRIKIPENKLPKVGVDNETGDYVFSIGVLELRYTKDQVNDWGLNNLMQAVGVTAAQFELAKTIGDAINRIPENIRNELDISVVGHSLGGGLASVIGLTTGKPTYTYNAEGVSNNFIKEWGLTDKIKNGDYNITAYHTSWDISTPGKIKVGDLLTTTQSSSLGVLIGGAKEIISPGTFVAKAIGKEEKLVMDKSFEGWHPQEAIVNHLHNKHAEIQSEWERIRYSRNSIFSAKQDGSLEKVDHINIVFK